MVAKYFGPALIASLAFAMPAAPAMAEGPEIAGVIELGSGFFAGKGDGSWDFGKNSWTETSTEHVIGGAARIGVELKPNLTMQFDGWAERWSTSYEGVDYYFEQDPRPYGDSYTSLLVGAAAHLTWRAENGFYAGLVAGLGGQEEDRTVGSLGVDVGYFGDTFHLYGQIGQTAGLTGDDAEYGLRETFGGLVGTYYLNDDFSITANVSLSRLTYADNPRTSDQVRWGAGLNYRPEGTPVVFTVGYQGTYASFAAPGEEGEETSHGVYAGIRVPFGAAEPSLREQDRTTGLGLASHYYGKFLPN